jgi:competence protein ComEC
MFSFKKVLAYSVIFLLLVAFTQFSSAQPFQEKIPLKVNFLDVGQGDAILINYLDQYQILVDSGISGKQILTELNKVTPKQDRLIEIVIATHYDKDHVGGMREVFDNYRVGVFLDNNQLKETGIVAAISDVLEKEKIKQHSVKENSEIEIGSDLKLKFFNPDGEDWNANDNSVVFRMDFGVNSFLFTGDSGFKTEKDLISDGHNLKVDWLKVAHHGSKNSSSNEFLEEVSPEKAVISVGKNSYGHPAEDALKRIQKIGAEVLTTLEEGTIEVDCWKEQKCQIQ